MRRRPIYGLNILFAGLAALLLMLTPRPGLALDVRTFCSPLEIHEGGPEEKACLEELASVAKRDGGVLTLKLNDGKTKVISDTKECDDPNKEGSCVRHRLVGHIGDRQFIVQVQPYECGYVLLVNRRTGAEMMLGALPDLSPNKKRFVVTGSFAAGECNAEYNVAIFSMAIDPKSVSSPI